MKASAATRTLNASWLGQKSDIFARFLQLATFARKAKYLFRC